MSPRQESPEAEHRSAVILWAAMLFAVVMYYVVIRTVQPDQATENPTVVRILLVFAVICALASFVVKNMLLARARTMNKPALRRIGLILALALSEAAAIYGVAVWFMTGWPRSYIFLLIGGAAIVLHYPAREEA